MQRPSHTTIKVVLEDFGTLVNQLNANQYNSYGYQQPATWGWITTTVMEGDLCIATHPGYQTVLCICYQQILYLYII
jgi:hypothetical protein